MMILHWIDGGICIYLIELIKILDGLWSFVI